MSNMTEKIRAAMRAELQRICDKFGNPAPDDLTTHLCNAASPYEDHTYRTMTEGLPTAKERLTKWMTHAKYCNQFDLWMPMMSDRGFKNPRPCKKLEEEFQIGLYYAGSLGIHTYCDIDEDMGEDSTCDGWPMLAIHDHKLMFKSMYAEEAVKNESPLTLDSDLQQIIATLRSNGPRRSDESTSVQEILQRIRKA